MAARRFPPPWSIVEHPESFAITGAAGQALAFVYFEDEPGHRSGWIDGTPPRSRLGGFSRLVGWAGSKIMLTCIMYCRVVTRPCLTSSKLQRRSLAPSLTRACFLSSSSIWTTWMTRRFSSSSRS
jgi:hypothetical protein